MPSVLAVDDSDSMRRMMSLTLKQAGYEVIPAVNGRDALAKLRKSHAANQHPIDLVLADIDMPTMNGFELVQNLRANPSYGSTPMILVSNEGNDVANPEEARIGKAAGANGILRKPVSALQLIDTVSQLIP